MPTRYSIIIKLLREQISRLVALPALIMLLGFVGACSDDDSWADNYITDFATLQTDGEGAVCAMQLDNGNLLSINSSRVNPVSTLEPERGHLTPDTLYRALCVYTVSDNTASIASLAAAFSPLPMPDSLFVAQGINIKTDPCRILAIWRGGSYINARMQVQGQLLTHYVAFVDKGITEKEDGKKILSILLYHDQNGDTEAFTRTVYLSVPLWPYRNILTRNQDSVFFYANEYGESMSVYKLPY